MFIDPSWRILTIGDGDFSFSYALSKISDPKLITASIYDNEQLLMQKYEFHKLQALRDKGITHLTGFDVKNPDTWQGLSLYSFDVVVFQFPLVPALGSAANFKHSESINTLNRALLRTYLEHCFKYFLDPKGPKLAYITSKDVKPYIEWNMESSLVNGLDLSYLGKMPFNFDLFPDYKIRNVDRDKHVKQTAAFTHVWGDKGSFELPISLMKPKELEGDFCAVCRAGPFATEQESAGHFASKKHARMTEFEQQWQDYLKAQP